MSSFTFKKGPEWVYNTDGMKIPPITPNDCVGWKVRYISILECILKFFLGVVQPSRDPKQGTDILGPAPSHSKQNTMLGFPIAEPDRGSLCLTAGSRAANGFGSGWGHPSWHLLPVSHMPEMPFNYFFLQVILRYTRRRTCNVKLCSVTGHPGVG